MVRPLPKPSINFEHLYSDCIHYKEADLKGRLKDCYPKILRGAGSYNGHATAAELHKLTRIKEEDIAPVVDDELKALYENQMVKNPSPGRRAYDDIMAAARGKCPFCGHNRVKTLDHFLPKNNYPEFSILPLNLVPCCRDCNSDGKRTARPTGVEDQYLHPYYEDVTGIQWLEAVTVFGITDSPTIVFFVNKDAQNLSITMYERLVFQFSTLDIGIIYSNQADTELSGMYHYFQEIHANGAGNLTQELVSLAKSKTLGNKNSWQAAMYRAISTDERFFKMDWSL